MAASDLDIQSAVDRLVNYAGRGRLWGFPTMSQTSNATTGVPTNGTQGWAPGALFFNFKAASAGTMLYVNVGTFSSSVWLNIDGAVNAVGSLGVTGVAAGYKVARVEMALDGSNPTAWATGLTTVVAACVSLAGAVAPGLGTSVLTYAISGATVNVYAWKPTGAGDTTLIASTGTETFSGIAVGT